MAPGIGPLVPHNAPDRQRLTALLRAAYVDARYSFGFQVSSEELDTLARYVCAFRACAERACQEQLAELAAARTVSGMTIPTGSIQTRRQLCPHRRWSRRGPGRSSG